MIINEYFISNGILFFLGLRFLRNSSLYLTESGLLSIEKVVLDIGKGTFAHGQIYIALSRCTSLEGLVLKKPIAKKHVWMDFKVVKFVTNYQYQKSDLLCSLEDKITILQRAIEDKATIYITYLLKNQG